MLLEFMPCFQLQHAAVLGRGNQFKEPLFVSPIRPNPNGQFRPVQKLIGSVSLSKVAYKFPLRLLWDSANYGRLLLKMIGRRGAGLTKK